MVTGNPTLALAAGEGFAEGSGNNRDVHPVLLRHHRAEAGFGAGFERIGEDLTR
jgi:hypothetical protein